VAIRPPWRLLGLGALLAATLGCGPEEVPDGLRRTPDGDGATVRFEPYALPLPDVPFPTDLLAFPDPSSRTGVRIALPTSAPTALQRTIHRNLANQEGWGTFAPITVAFDLDRADAQDPVLDLANLRDRHQNDDYEFANDAVYLVNLRTGVPVPLELGAGSHSPILASRREVGRLDPRSAEPSLLWETADEAANPSTGQTDASRTDYQPAFDTDFDGVLDRPNLEDRGACPNQVQVALGDTAVDARDRCLADHLMTWYERETDTLVVRPLLPLEEKTPYAVVLTDRLVDSAGNPVRSPFEYTYHPAQVRSIRRLHEHLETTRLRSYFGDIGGTGLEHVAFAWTFTTAPTIEDLTLLRNGLYGTGAFASLQDEFPAELWAERVVGRLTPEALAAGETPPAGWENDDDCVAALERPRIVRVEPLLAALDALTPAQLGFDTDAKKATFIAGLRSLDHLVLGSYRSPFFLSGGPDSSARTSTFDLNFRTGVGDHWTDTVPVWIAVPRETESQAQPFGVSLHAHRFGGSPVDLLQVAGQMSQVGLATVAFTAPWHGPRANQVGILQDLFSSTCYLPAASHGARRRNRDLDGDGTAEDDVGANFWSVDPVHSRDVLRQGIVDGLQLLRSLKALDGRRSDQDFDEDGQPDLAGDFDANGVPDLGGPDAVYSAWGDGLGGALSVPLGALDPNVLAVAPIGGSGSLPDLTERTNDPELYASLWLPAATPLIAGVPAADLEAGETRCAPGEVSLRFTGLHVLQSVEVEFQCLDINEVTDGVGLPDGGTVLAVNGENRLHRCARVSPHGGFRVAIPADAGDRLELQLFDEPDVVDSYHPDHGCNLEPEAHRVAIISTWGAGSGGSSASPSECELAERCTLFLDDAHPAGSALVAVDSGLGLILQTPAARRWWTLAAHAWSIADAAGFARHYALGALPGPGGRTRRSTGALLVAPVGDQNWPIDAQLSVARAMGALPFLRPDAAARYPDYVDYVTPPSLYQAWGEMTPSRLLATRHVVEGVARLGRQPPDACGVNEVVADGPSQCHPACDSGCAAGQACDSDSLLCVAEPVSAETCAQSLFDPDAIDEGSAGYGQRVASVPLRLGRVAAPATPDTIEETWEPRLAGTPFETHTDTWRADKRVVALLMPYLDPLGASTVGTIDPCQSFSMDRYVRHLVARFFETRGADVYYLSHPSSHHCLEAADCPFLTQR